MEERKSWRRYVDEALSLEELLLLWATQGVRTEKRGRVFERSVWGNRHSFETYLAVFQVTGLAVGIYRYLPLEHALVFEVDVPELASRLDEATRNQVFVSRAAVAFLWTVLPYRMEWRYMNASVKTIALDAGHLCQNLYLAAGAIGCDLCHSRL